MPTDAILIWTHVTEEGHRRGFQFFVREPWHDALVMFTSIGRPEDAVGQLGGETKNST